MPKWEKTIRWPAILACFLLLAGCTEGAGSIGKPDWQDRIGRYSLDDATRELGPPESCVALDDGGTACSWTTLKGRELIERLILTFDLKKQLATASNVHL